MSPKTADPIRIEIAEITPEQAEHLLAGAAGIPQRGMTQRRVAAFASAMARGQWKVTHQAIAIDPAGVLIDGQHRLSAVVMAGIPVRMMIAYNVPRESYDVIDTGMARTTAAALHIAGYSDPNVTAAAARAVLLYEQIAGSKRVPNGALRSNATTIDVLDFLASERGELLRGAIPPARGIAASLARNGIRTAMTASLMMIDETDPDIQLRTEFVDKMHSGAMLSDDSPILRFRRWVTSDTGYDRTDRAYRAQITQAAIFQTWNAWTTGRPLGVIRVRPGREDWPTIAGRSIEWAMAAADYVTPQRVELYA